ncbi:MAG: MFS transporter [Pseudomonadales bacterium]
MSLQGFLMTSLLVVILDLPADRTGWARLISELPPLAILLLGGVLGDRSNSRSYLTLMHCLMALPPLMMAAVYGLGALSYWWVVLFGVLMASIQSLSDPARQSTLSRVTNLDIQRAVTVMTIVTSLVGLAGFQLGSKLESWGVSIVLILQSLLFFAGVFAIRALPSLPSLHSAKTRVSARQSLSQGLRAIQQVPLLRNIIGLNFLSSLFNAGAYIIAIPYIITDVYGGTAATLATAMIVFTIGSIGSNLILLACMPLRYPGRLFLFMQLTRIIILLALWFEPPTWLFYLVLVGWGLNMGVTTTMVRTTVQELAPAVDRAQILSILLLSFMVSSPISAVLLGYLIEGASPIDAMIPGVIISLTIFILGIGFSGLWQFQSNAGTKPSKTPAADQEGAG